MIWKERGLKTGPKQRASRMLAGANAQKGLRLAPNKWINNSHNISIGRLKQSRTHSPDCGNCVLSTSNLGGFYIYFFKHSPCMAT